MMLGGCNRAKQAPARIPQASDSLYTARAALIIYGTEPERALTIIDSALIVGNVSPFRADFIRARIYANSVVGPRLDTAIDLCEVLLQHDSTCVVDKATAANRSDVLEVMMAACRKRHDDNHWLQYAIERADLSRSQGMETEALRMEGEIGAVMTRLGRREEGLIKLEQVINALDQGEPSVDRMDAGIVARKRRIIVYDDAGRFWDIIPDAEAIIKKLEAKGFIRRDEPGFICTPLVSQSEIQKSEAESLVNKFFGGSRSALFSALLEGKKLSDKEIEELRDLIDKR